MVLYWIFSVVMLQVRVFLSKSSDTAVFERLVSLSPDIVFDYQAVINGLHCLYGDKCVIDFKLDTL